MSEAALADLATPALLLDRARLEKNTRAMAARATGAGVRLRPHLKTAKSAEVARLATAGHFGGITVSTLAEAEYFWGHGISDITYAVCIVPDKLERAAALVRRGARLTLLTDSAEVAGRLDARAAELGVRFSVLIEIDSGEHRTGVGWDGPAVIAIARALDSARALDLQGVLTHAGHSYACTSVAEIKRVAEDERLAVVSAASHLRDAGFVCATVSAGSTPTAVHAESFAGLTEIRPGVYMFFDLAQLGRGSCELGDIALTVLATVISHHPPSSRAGRSRLVIDAGGLALSKDTSAGDHLPGAGYGWIVDPCTAERIGDLRVALVDQEHGYVDGTAIPRGRLPVGAKVRVVPNHACMTAAQYPRYAVVDGDRVIARWERANGW
jgi:D-serine deaminase-like pyridoxal phosphate-dependent protein